MNVQQLIEALSTMGKDKIVIVTDPNGIGWSNIGKIAEDECTIKIMEEEDTLFSES